jgi:hypothetical protein
VTDPPLSGPPRLAPKRARRLLGGIVAGCLGAVILAVGLFSLVVMARLWWAEAQVYGWFEGAATIMEARAWAPPGARGDPALSVRFQYVYAGRTYESDRVDARSSVRHPEAFQLVALWQPSSRWPCYVDPRNPQTAVLRRDSLWWGLAVFLPLVVGGGMGGLFLYAAWASLRAKGGPAMALAPSSFVGAARRAVGRIAALLLVVSLVLVTYVAGVRPLLLFESAAHWRELPCTIVASRARAHSNGMRTGYSAEIVFQYYFDSRKWASAQYELSDNNNRSYQDVAGIVKRYPPGAGANCYVDPIKPDLAVLDRSFPRGTALGLLPLGLLIAVIWRLTGLRQKHFRGELGVRQRTLSKP